MGRAEPGEIIVDQVWFGGVPGMEHAQQVDENAPLLEERVRPLDSCMRGPAIGAPPERIVKWRRPVQAQADTEAFPGQEA